MRLLAFPLLSLAAASRFGDAPGRCLFACPISEINVAYVHVRDRPPIRDGLQKQASVLCSDDAKGKT